MNGNIFPRGCLILIALFALTGSRYYLFTNKNLMTKNEFKHLAAALKVNARYSGKLKTMFVNVHHLTHTGRFLWSQPVNFKIKNA